MDYKHKIKDDVLELSFSGDLIGENHGAELIGIVSEALDSNAKFACIDISEVRYINSSGIGVLITILTKFRNKDGEVVLIKPSQHVQKLLIITKLTNIFKIADNMEEAREILSQA